MSESLTGAILNPEIVRGKSAYEIAVEHGFKGTETEWLSYISANAEQAEAARERAETAAANASRDATTAANAEVTRVIGEIGIAQILGDSKTHAISQNTATENFNKCNKRITNLEKGIVPDPFYTDDSVAYAKVVPDGALPYAEVSKIGGMSYRDEATNTLKNAKVTSIKATGKNLFKVETIQHDESQSGLTLKKVDENGVYVSGTANALMQRKLFGVNTSSIPEGYYYISGKTENIELYAEIRKNGAYVATKFADRALYVDRSESTTIDICIQVRGGVSVNETIYPMLNTGSEALQYEPYKESEIQMPQEVQAFDGYGLGVNSAYCNHIDLQSKKYKQIEKEYVCKGGSDVNLSLIGESKNNPCFTFIVNGHLYGRKYGTPCTVSAPFKLGEQGDVWAGLSGSYAFAPYNTNAGAESSFYVSFSHEDLGVSKDSYDDTLVNSAKALLKRLYDSGTPLTVVYALKTPVETDISDLLTDDNFIEVSEGGLVIAENENGLDVPTTIVYQTEHAAGGYPDEGDYPEWEGGSY